MKEEYGKLVKSALIVLGGLIIIDVFVGQLYAALYKRISTNVGQTASMKYSMVDANEDVILLGSSRSTHHYNPKIIAKVFPRQSIVNLGRDGIDFAYSCCQLKSISLRKPLKHHTFIIDMNASSLSEHAFYNVDVLHPFYTIDYVRETILSQNPRADIQYLCSLYRYNGDTFKMIKAILFRHEGIKDGFEPLQGTSRMAEFKAGKDYGRLDVAACRQLKEIISISRRNKNNLIFAMSPLYEGVNESNSETLRYLERVCKENDIPFYNFINDKYFISHPELFKDRGHLNVRGATIFSDKIVLQMMSSSK